MNAKDKRNSRWAAVSLAAAAALAACGGDPSPPPPATSQVPASASESTTGFIEYLKLLVASSADTLEPVDTSMVTAPIDDTGEPAAIP
jgi:ABC-type glycerol-3-phosphate transport system substrate-binding protein